jgi:hypothetical protein
VALHRMLLAQTPNWSSPQLIDTRLTFAYNKTSLQPDEKEATMFLGAAGIYTLIGIVVAICLILYVFAKKVK